MVVGVHLDLSVKPNGVHDAPEGVVLVSGEARRWPLRQGVAKRVAAPEFIQVPPQGATLGVVFDETQCHELSSVASAGVSFRECDERATKAVDVPEGFVVF